MAQGHGKVVDGGISSDAPRGRACPELVEGASPSLVFRSNGDGLPPARIGWNLIGSSGDDFAVALGGGRNEVAVLRATRQDDSVEAKNMKLTKPLHEMTTVEKLQAIEEIWACLERAADELPSPGWHADVLAAREHRVREGASRFSDWGTAKARIREKA